MTDTKLKPTTDTRGPNDMLSNAQIVSKVRKWRKIRYLVSISAPTAQGDADVQNLKAELRRLDGELGPYDIIGVLLAELDKKWPEDPF